LTLLSRPAKSFRLKKRKQSKDSVVLLDTKKNGWKVAPDMFFCQAKILRATAWENLGKNLVSDIHSAILNFSAILGLLDVQQVDLSAACTY
jgi:hypothetical protein